MPAAQTTFATLSSNPHHYTDTAQEEEQEKREAFRKETLQAWAMYQATELHATGNEVIAWLQTWGTDSETVAPTCHK